MFTARIHSVFAGVFTSLCLLAGGCAAGASAQRVQSASYAAKPGAPTAYMAVPVYVAGAPAQQRVIIAAPPPASAAPTPAPAPSASMAPAASEVQAPAAPAVAPASFKPTDSPLLALHKKGPQGQKPDPIDPLLTRNYGHSTVTYVPYGYYGSYYGNYAGGYYPPYYRYSSYYSPYYGASYYGGYRYPGWGVGVGVGLGLGLGAGWGHHHHGGYAHHGGGHHGWHH
jgi:hypothetical protein